MKGIFLMEVRKKTKEADCLNKVLKCRINKGTFAVDMHKALIDKKDYIDCSCERPDIIINTNVEIIGIEHCSVDMLFRVKNKKAQSMIGIQQSKSEKLVEKYKDKELLDEHIKSGMALKPVLEMVEERFELRNKFDYAAFIDNFRRVCGEHNDNCKDYREHMQAMEPGKNDKLACLIEIPYLKEDYYRITDSRGTRCQSLNGIPITEDMVLTIQNMKGFDFVILCMYSLNSHRNENSVVCYYFLPCAVQEGIKQQGIKPVLSFDLVEKPDVKFSDEYEFRDGKIKIKAKSSFANRKKKSIFT